MKLRSTLRQRLAWLTPAWRRTRGALDATKLYWQQSAAERAVSAFPRTRQKARHPLPGKLIVSLTSYPPRFAILHKAIRSLLDQQVAADEVILWIAEGDLRLLPEAVLDLRQHGLTIRTCPDLRSFKKLVPALCEHPEAFIVTADDDVFYPPTWLGALVSACRPPFRTIVGTRAHVARFGSSGRPFRYAKWIRNAAAADFAGERSILFLTGVGGILYPPNSLHADTVRVDRFSQLCPHADDVWFFAMSELAGSQRVRTTQSLDLPPWRNSQKCALLQRNVEDGGNDQQLENVLRAYPILHARFAAHVPDQQHEHRKVG